MFHLLRTSRLILGLAALTVLTASQAFAQLGDSSPQERRVSPVISVDPASLDFGRVCIGQFRDLVVTIRDSIPGNADPLNITSLTVTPPYSLIGVPPPPPTIVIPTNGSLAVTVRYTPSAGGPQPGTLTILSDNATNSPKLVPLSGSGNRPPVCNAGGPYNANQGQPIQFNGTGSTDPDGGPLTYAWNFGDGNTGTGAQPTHTYADDGVFNVSLTVTDDCGASSQCQTTATITNTPPVCNANGPYNGLQGQPIQFNGTGSTDPDGTIVTYAWNFGDGNTGTGASPTHTYADDGVFNVSLTVTDDDGAQSNCQTTATVTNRPPVCNADGPYNGNQGQPIQFNGTGSTDPDGTIVTYAWNFGDGNTGTGASPTHTYADDGVFNVSLTVTDDDGAQSNCQTTATVTNTSPVCNAGGPYNGQINQPVQFNGGGSNDPDGTIVAYAWNFGDGNTATGVNPTHTYTAPGNFLVTLCVTDDDGAQSCCETTANITEEPNVPPQCNADGPYAGQVGQPIQFDGTGSTDPDGTIVAYDWDFGDGNTGTGAQPTHTYATAGSFLVELCVTDNDGAQVCCETDATIEAEPNLPPECDAGGPYAGNVGQPIQFDGTGSTDPDGFIITYEWDFGDGNSDFGAQPTHTYNAAGQFVVVLCVTDDDSTRVCCTTTADITGGTPVDLVSFTATSVDGTVLLSWRTGFEQNHAGFEVFRAPDGSDAFERVSGNDLVVDDNQDHTYFFTDRAVEAGSSYLYQLEAVARNGDRQTFAPLRVSVSQAVPGALVLHPSRPNPFNPSTTISFDLPSAGVVTVRIYDGSGRLVRTLADAATFPAGTHSMPWDGLDQRGQGAPSGVYLIKLGSGSRLLTEKIVLTR